MAIRLADIEATLWLMLESDDRDQVIRNLEQAATLATRILGTAAGGDRLETRMALERVVSHNRGVLETYRNTPTR